MLLLCCQGDSIDNQLVLHRRADRSRSAEATARLRQAACANLTVCEHTITRGKYNQILENDCAGYATRPLESVPGSEVGPLDSDNCKEIDCSKWSDALGKCEWYYGHQTTALERSYLVSPFPLDLTVLIASLINVCLIPLVIREAFIARKRTEARSTEEVFELQNYGSDCGPV